MPLVSLRIGTPESGTSFTLLLERVQHVDYMRMCTTLNALHCAHSSLTPTIAKPMVQQLLSFAQSDRECECVRYVVFKASGLTQTQVEKKYGFQNMHERAGAIENALSEIRGIRETIDHLATIEDKAYLTTLGISPEDSSEDSDLDKLEDIETRHSFYDCMENDYVQETVESATRLPPNSLKGLLSKCNFNCFEFTEKHPEISLRELESFLNDPKSELNEHQHHLLEQSFRAMEVVNKEAYGDNRIARAINEEVVTESESDNPDAYASLCDPLSQTGKNIIMKRRAAIRRRARRARAKVIAEQAYFSRKVSKRVSRVLKECPNIGQTIEDFVKASNVGADQWRRTGVLTFDGNTKLPMKVTYGRIKTHVEEVYQRSFSYGTIVQLCVPRNRRRCSAKRYQGVAKVTTRRARKGFTLRYNPDSHWSGSLYKGLDVIQYQDGRDIVNINRDDSSGFRLDTLTTNKQYSVIDGITVHVRNPNHIQLTY